MKMWLKQCSTHIVDICSIWEAKRSIPWQKKLYNIIRIKEKQNKERTENKNKKAL